jgi:hypothetical protein
MKVTIEIDDEDRAHVEHAVVAGNVGTTLWSARNGALVGFHAMLRSRVDHAISQACAQMAKHIGHTDP